MNLFGDLTLAALYNGPIVLAAQILIATLGLTLAVLLTYFKRWHWLWHEWLTSVDPKKIGVMYIVVAVVMLFRGLVDAAMMRAQQAIAASPSTGYLEPHHFDQLFTAHGVIMIFFVAMPIMFGLINIVVPLQIGARDVAFPFLNSLSFWLFVAGAILVNLSLVLGEFAATGWLAYPPLSEMAYSPSVGVDYYIWSLQVAGLGSLFSGVNFITTILRMRAPGMTLMRMPIFVWTALGSMGLVVFAFPILTATLALLSLDRELGMHFFTTGGGGNAMMYVNLIWAWGHPEVYILILPAFGVFSEVVATFSQKRLFGYTSMVVATMSITVLSFTVWLHHFFTMGSGARVNAVFGIATMIIAIPTGVKIFNWLFTMYRGRVQFTSPILWFLGFVLTFTIGGMTGVLMSMPPADFQIHNSLFLVAHFHNMIIGGVLFGYFAGITFWFPKIYGFKLDERLGIYAFWFWVVGFLVAFIPLYMLGLMGMTRRLDHYEVATGWQPLLILAAVGGCIILAGILLQVAQFVVSFRNRKKLRDATGDPWNGRTLEWSTSSPPPIYNFAHIPLVHGRDAFWGMKHMTHELQAAQEYQDIELPANTAMGLYISGFAFLAGFSLIWHVWWLLPVSIIGVILCLIVRSFDMHTHYIIPASEVAHIERRRYHTSI